MGLVVEYLFVCIHIYLHSIFKCCLLLWILIMKLRKMKNIIFNFGNRVFALRSEPFPLCGFPWVFLFLLYFYCVFFILILISLLIVLHMRFLNLRGSLFLPPKEGSNCQKKSSSWCWIQVSLSFPLFFSFFFFFIETSIELRYFLNAHVICRSSSSAGTSFFLLAFHSPRRRAGSQGRGKRIGARGELAVWASVSVSSSCCSASLSAALTGQVYVSFRFVWLRFGSVPTSPLPPTTSLRPSSTISFLMCFHAIYLCFSQVQLRLLSI